MERTSIRIPRGMLRKLDEVVEEDQMFADRSEAVRYAVRNYLQAQEYTGDQ